MNFAKNGDTIVIKPAEISDAAYIKKIAYNTWYEAYSDILADEQITYMLQEIYNETVLRDLIIRNSQKFIILFNDKLPKAFASYGPVGNGNLKLFKIYVLPEAQGLGYGDRLIMEVKKKAISGSYKFLELNVNRRNKALAYYVKKGFVIYEEIDIPIGPFWMNDYVMRLKIND